MMPKLFSLFTRSFPRRFVRQQSGSTAIEYALIATFVTIAILGVLFGLSDSVSNMYDNTANAIQ